MRLHIALPQGAHDVEIQNGLLGELGRRIRRLCPLGRVALVSDRIVMAAHGQTLLDGLKPARIEAIEILVDEGEAAKSIESAAAVWRRLAAAGVERNEPLVAFGGGAVGDLAGFVAATYKRGLRLVNVPTTLLAQVDSCIGGKNGVNLHAGLAASGRASEGGQVAKNVIGTVRQPAAVFVDPAVLTTLPEPYYKSGLAEVAKYAIMEGGRFFNGTASSIGPDGRIREELLEQVIRRCLRIKRAFVELDVNDLGERHLLNFGHTFGHALEAHLGDGHAWRHGHCVAVGMVVASLVAARRGACDGKTVEGVAGLLRTMGLPTSLLASQINGAMERINMDKKWRGGRLRFVLPRRVGMLVIDDGVTAEDIEIAASEGAGSCTSGVSNGGR